MTVGGVKELIRLSGRHRAIPPFVSLWPIVCERRRPYVRGVHDKLAAQAPVWDVTDLSDGEIAEDPRCGGFDGVTTFSESQLVRTAAIAHRWGCSS